MNKEWMLLIIAASFEVGWVIGLKYATNLLEWGATVLAIIISFWLLIRSGSRLPVGTAYAVFVGLGTGGTVIFDMAMFGEPFRWEVIMLIVLLLIGVLGLKMRTVKKEEVQGEGDA